MSKITATLAGLFALAVTPLPGHAAAPPAAKPPCVADEEGGFKQVGSNAVFIVALSNACAKRIKCVVNANMTSAFGSQLGKAVIQLPPKTATGPSRANHAFPVKQAGGTAEVARKCTG